MADENATVAPQPQMSAALNTEMPRYPIEVQRVLDLGAKNAQDQAGIASDVAAKRTEMMAPISDQYKGQIDQTGQVIKDIGEQQKKPFEVPKETAADFAQLGGLVAVMGAMLGTSGKMSANNVLAAITGTLDGYKAGRKDVVANSIKAFDENMKRLQAMSQNATAQLEMYTKSFAVDKDKAEQILAQYQANLNKGIAAQDYKAKTGMDALKTANEIKRLNQQAAELTQKVKEFDTREMLGSMMYDQEAKVWKGWDQKTRQFVPIEGTESLITKTATNPRGGAANAVQVAMNQRASNALGGISSVTDVIQSLPANSNIGVLQSLQTKDGMFNAMRNMAGRKLSSDEAQAIETLYTGVTRNLAAIEASGAATGLVGLANQMEKLIPKAGDSAYTVALKIADLRRIAVENILPLVESGLLLPGQKEAIESRIAKIEKSIPYTTQDVVTARFGKRDTNRDSGAKITGTQTDEQKARAVWGEYKPDVYEYGTNPATGKFSRKKKNG